MTRDSELTELDPRFPIRCAEPPYLFDVVLARHPRVAADLKRRAAAADVVSVERYVTPLLTSTAPMPAVTVSPELAAELVHRAAGPTYRDLTEPVLDEEWSRVLHGTRDPAGTVIFGQCVCPDNGDQRLDCPVHGDDVGLGILGQGDQP